MGSIVSAAFTLSALVGDRVPLPLKAALIHRTRIALDRCVTLSIVSVVDVLSSAGTDDCPTTTLLSFLTRHISV